MEAQALYTDSNDVLIDLISFLHLCWETERMIKSSGRVVNDEQSYREYLELARSNHRF